MNKRGECLFFFIHGILLWFLKKIKKGFEVIILDPDPRGLELLDPIVVDPWHTGTDPDLDPGNWPIDPDSDSDIFVLDLQDANKSLSAAYFLKVHLHNISR
jgi:hypothetical protein